MANKELRSLTFPDLTDTYIVPPSSNTAPTYSPASTYAVGDHVTYIGKLYRCTTAITTAEAWNASHWTLASLSTDLEGQVSDLKNALDSLTNAYIKTFALSSADYSTKYDASGTLTNDTAVKSFIFPLVDGASYELSAQGSFNRWIVSVCDSTTVGTSCVRLLTDLSGEVTSRSFSFTNSDDHKYAVVLVAYDVSNIYYATLNVKESVGSVNDGFFVNGYKVALDSQMGDYLHRVTDGYYIAPISYTDTNNAINNGKITNQVVGKLAYAQIENGAKYKIVLSGVFNRFTVGVCDSVALGTTVTKIRDDGAETHTQKTKEYTFTNSNNNQYVVIFYNYNGDGTVSNINLTIEKIAEKPTFEVNGIRVYTADETFGLFEQATKNYVSPIDVSLADDTADLYTLYDALVTAYPQYVSKNVLGQDSEGTDLVEYVFTSGNYNSYATALRNQDSSITKPLVMVLTGCHGYEKTSVMATYQFCKDLCDGNENLLSIRGNYILKVIPMGCPSSFDNDARVNSNGVNIERNFNYNWGKSGEGTDDFSGNSVADQPETQIIQNWIDANTDAELFIDYHNSAYANEVSYIGGKNTITGMAEFKSNYLEGIFRFEPFLEIVRGFSTSLVYAYTGVFGDISTAFHYATSKGMVSVCLECSWNQNSSGQHSSLSIKTGAEILGNILANYFKD